MLYQQAPAGRGIQLTAHLDYEEKLAGLFPGYFQQWYASGTAALAATLQALVTKTKTSAPEVLIPAYTCPALVAAILYAGAKPVLVDLEPNSTFLSQASLEDKVSAHSVALIAVDLFGIQERGQILKTFAEVHNLSLIEDSAQYLPKTIKHDTFFGDYVILSFGRGKPASILHAGAVLSRHNERLKGLPRAQAQSINQLAYRFKTALYNIMLSPRLYWLPQSLPFLKLGATEYVPLLKLLALELDLARYLPANIQAYQTSSEQLLAEYKTVISRYRSDQLFSPTDNANQKATLSRFPLLFADAKLREKVYAYLYKRGCGVSLMYNRALPDIAAIPEQVRVQGPFPNAAHFAGALLTLPIHPRVRSRDIENLSSALMQYLN